MLLWLKRIFIFLTLIIFGRGRCDTFLEEVKRHCKKRRHRRHVAGITEALDDLVDLPDNCKDDISFLGFTKDGHIASFRITKADQEYASLAMEVPGIGQFTYNNSRPLERQPGPLKLQMLEPMRRWKISFCGRVEQQTGAADNERLHMSVSLHWQCLADPFDHRNCISTWQLAKNLSDLPWKAALNMKFDQESISYEQWGELWGRIEIEGHGSQSIRLKSCRNHKIERAGAMSGQTVVSHNLIRENGSHYITNGVVCGKTQTVNERFGCITLPVGERWPTDQSDLNPQTGKGSKQLDVQYPFHMNANGPSFKFVDSVRKEVPLKIVSKVFDLSVYFTTCTVNSAPTYGICMRETLLPFAPTRVTRTAANNNDTNNKLVTQLDARDCMVAASVGGKGANLSTLRSLGFLVPNAICATTNALQRQKTFSDALRLSAEMILTQSGTKAQTEMQMLCETAVKKWKESEMCPDIARAIEDELIRVFGQDFRTISFAVRSSGVSEDGKESSYAGQMETYLGIKGLDNILEAVRKCWASSFAYQTVAYRRQNGQPVVESMAVVIQEMVDADVAGVLFTNDPVTGNSSTMVLNATPGLGETVVSGKSNPDTITVRRTGKQEELNITEKEIGNKPVKLVCSPDTGLSEVQSDTMEQAKLCLQDCQILEVCNIGVKLEERLGAPQDIEWAISDGKLYLLQTRPITTQNEETDEELLHEFDSPLALDKESATLYNIGEMFPGVATTLTNDLFVSAVSDSIDKFMGTSSGVVVSKYAYKSSLSFTNRPFLGLTAISLPTDCFMQDKASFDISVAGREIEEHGMDIIQAFKGGPVTRLKSLKSFINANFIQAPRNDKWYSKWEETLTSFSLVNDCSTAMRLYANIDENLHFFYDAWRAYIYSTTRSIVPFAVIFKILQGKSSAVSSDVNADLAVLISGCPDVYTAGLPQSIQELANAIAASDVKDAFMQLPDEGGHDCLMNADGSVKTRYKTLLDMHGHRCVKESEFMKKGWGSDPSALIHAIKAVIKSPSKKTQPVQATEVDFSQLKTPLSWFQKFLIRSVFLDKAKAGVASRELGKSRVVKTADVFKIGYWKLAELMVREGRLPEEKLLFFLTHLEIGALLETRSAVLVRKARRRMRIFPQMEATRYPNICIGIPVPLPENQDDDIDASFVVKGMPVGKGVAKGRACVVLSLEDADNIQAGDILICPFTDVGWSPYFPLIAGLVTEMGGTVSHGAVVAREVGIPCVVKALDATRIFKTGEMVKIDGLAGVLEKLDA